ncbi:MAG: AMP-binding protein [Christensenellaceae bacterium]|jgi:acetyl-CoA synthetase|nr:AMP-binding protein [Christensenellaceae bacterium]
MFAQNASPTSPELREVAARIHELREIAGYTQEEMAQYANVSVEDYRLYEAARADLPFSFIHKCALTFNVGITDLMEGQSARLSSYTVTRRGQGQTTAKEPGIEIKNLAPLFRSKIAEPYWVTYEYAEDQQNKPIHLATHGGQEFDIILNGKLKVQVGSNVEVLGEGDCIYYDSSAPHGMLAVDGADCTFCAVILPGEESGARENLGETILPAKTTQRLIYEDFVTTAEDETGALQGISFQNQEQFNFAFDVVDALAAKKPGKLAMLHLDNDKVARSFSFEDMKLQSARAANYFKSLGIQKGDRVMLVLKRSYHFWFAILGLHKLGAIAVPATDQLLEKDFEYRFQSANINAVLCTANSGAPAEAEKAVANCPSVKHLILCGGQREGWHDYDTESALFSRSFHRAPDSSCGSDPMLMFFTSGTTGYPKIVTQSYKYALGHFATAKYWHCVNPDGLHFTISDTGWGKAMWGKLYGQWLCEGAIFTYDFDRFNAPEILSLFKQYNITTFCAPPTMYRFMIKEDLSKYDLSSIVHATTAGEALNPEVFHQFKKATGLSIMEGFGQTETTLVIGNFVGMKPKIGSMGMPNPLYDVALLTADGLPAAVGEPGEICIRTHEHIPCGLFSGYQDAETTTEAWSNDVYHTGDLAWRDEDGYFWYVSRKDDVIKSSGYRIGPFEIESVIMELPYVLECGVSAAPDEIRGQVVKASVVLTKGTEPSEALKREIQDYVKHRTAPYKYPRIVVFREELPKTISGKIRRNAL